MTDARTAFVPGVAPFASPIDSPIDDAARLRDELARRNAGIAAVVPNRSFHEELRDRALAQAPWDPDRARSFLQCCAAGPGPCSPHMGERLCLVGMSGVGKTFWSKRLAACGWIHHDCDAEIGKRLAALAPCGPGEEPVHALGRWMGMPWSDEYERREARYLELEGEVTRAAIEAASADDREHVIDTTGSVVYLDGALLARLRASCRVVYLRATEAQQDALLRRHLEAPRPVVWAGAFTLREGETPAQALPRCYRELLRRRDRCYLALAHVVLDAETLELRDPGLDAFLRAVRASA